MKPNPYSDRQYRRLRAQFRYDCERNKLACSICFQPIDYRLRRPHNDAWELHHERPTSTHPHLMMVRANWRPSHASCNKSQGNKPRGRWVRPTW